LDFLPGTFFLPLTLLDTAAVLFLLLPAKSTETNLSCLGKFSVYYLMGKCCGLAAFDFACSKLSQSGVWLLKDSASGPGCSRLQDIGSNYSCSTAFLFSSQTTYPTSPSSSSFL
jgi:hypothetical protein